MEHGFGLIEFVEEDDIGFTFEEFLCETVLRVTSTEEVGGEVVAVEHRKLLSEEVFK